MADGPATETATWTEWGARDPSGYVHRWGAEEAARHAARRRGYVLVSRQVTRTVTETPWGPADGEDEPAPKAAEPCPGFQWIGQPFTSCDGCGKPAWEHEGELRLRPGSALLAAGDCWELRPWRPGEAEAIRRKWAS